MAEFADALSNEDKLVRVVTLLTVSGALILGLVTINAFLISLTGTWRLRLLPFDLAILAGWWVFWLIKRFRLPRNNTDKLGIVIALTTENDKAKTRVKADLVKRLRQLIRDEDLENWATIVECANHQAERLVPFLERYSLASSVFSKTQPPHRLAKKWRKIKRTVRGNLYIFGSVAERQSGENAYFLDTNAFVVHTPLGEDVRKQLTQDFADVWSKQVTFLEKIERQGFEFTVHFWFVAALYIIGCAAFAYDDLGTAVKCLEAVKRRLHSLRHMPSFVRIQTRVNKLLATAYALFASGYFTQGDVAEARTYLQKCLAIEPRNYNGNLVKSQIEFVFEHDPRKALSTVEGTRQAGGKDRTWMYNQGFLLMYLERFEQALAVYRKLAKYTYDEEIDLIVPQIVAFNENLLRTEPEKFQSLFILGFVKMYKTLNYPEALEHFEKFVSSVGGNRKYRRLVEEALICLAELRAKMGLSRAS